MKSKPHTIVLVLLVMTAALLVTDQPQAKAANSIKKTIHIKNPTRDETFDDLHLTFYKTPLDTWGQTKVGQSSDRFEASVILGGSKKIEYSQGTLPNGVTDHMGVKLAGSTKGPTAAKLVKKVEFTKKGKVEHVLDQSSRQNRKAFKKYVTGFTNEEYFDFSDLDSSWLHILNSEADLNIQYTLYDFKVYKNIPMSYFELDSIWDTTPPTGDLVYSQGVVVINPGTAESVFLEAVLDETYAFASITSLVVTDLDTDETILYDLGQVFAETVPEPGTIALLALGSVALLHRRRR